MNFFFYNLDESTPLLVKVNTPFKSERQKLFQDIFLISPSDFVDSGALRKIYSIVKVRYIHHISFEFFQFNINLISYLIYLYLSLLNEFRKTAQSIFSKQAVWIFNCLCKTL